VYQVSAIAATCGITALAVGATYYRYIMHMDSPDAPFPWLDMGCTLALVAGGVFGMEMWARWAHRVLWHDLAAGWALHKSHHEPRTGPFEVRRVLGSTASYCSLPERGSIVRLWASVALL
jgi:beta-carotene 3-hydroxylase